MLGFLSAFVLVFFVLIFIKAYCRLNGGKDLTKKLSESDLVKKFNSLVKNLTERNLENVKFELLDVLDKYREVKCNGFIESKTILVNSKESILQQVEILSQEESNLLSNIYTIKECMQNGQFTESDVDAGARFLYEVEKLRDVRDSLKKAVEDLNEKINSIDNNINLFNHRYLLKKSEITLMIANAISVQNVSGIDLKLNDLVTEFKTKVRENEIKKEVTGKIYNVPTSQTTEKDFNKDEYIEKLKSFEVK
jgi:hypothetical protein